MFSNPNLMKKYLILSIFALLSCAAFSQKKSPIAISDSILFKHCSYRQIGPFRGGRSAAVVGDAKEKNLFYMGATGGGVWKTKDGGSNWTNISDKYFGGSIGAISIAPSDADIIYVGEGENSLRGNVSEGFGIWRSNDGGRTWKNLGLKDTRHIVRIVIHPKNPDIVWVAAIGHLFGPNEERGVFKTTDGGKTWKNVLFSDKQSGAVDLVMDPTNPDVLFASTWTVIRTPYSMESGGAGSALWKSTDGGNSWNKLNDKKGFPNKSVLGIIGVAIAPSNPDKIYAIIENENGGLYKSENGGESWELQNSTNDIRQRAWYYSKVFVDPKNEHIVYVLNVEFLKSTDAGKTFKSIPTPHGDHHDLWIDPKDEKRMIVADDGGAQISFDGGDHWSTYYNQPTAQFYRVSTDNHYPYRILGAQQDNSTVRILSRTQRSQISTGDWSSTAGFESGYVVADPSNPDIVYGGNYGGFLSRMDHKTGENRAISVWPVNPIGAGADIQKYRFQWNFPIFFSPHNPKKLYAAGNVLFVSEDEGASWKALGGDLTTNDKSKQGPSGGPITKDNTSVEYYCTIFCATESALEKDVLWAGSDDGLIHLSKDAGANWVNVTPPKAGKWMMWNSVEVDPFVKGKAYFVGTKYKLDDYTPYIFKTEDYGKTWTIISNGIPNNHFTRVLRADKKREGLLYCGTEYGMYISYDDGANWRSMQLNLPLVPITDLTLKENDLIVATQGRSFWVLDDLSMFQQYDAKITEAELFIADVNPTYLYDGYHSKNVVNSGSNPQFGPLINYYIKNLSDSATVSIKLMNLKGEKIKTYSNKASDKKLKIEAEQGMNQFEWDTYYPEGEKIEGMILWNGNAGGPRAAPGKYKVRIIHDKDSLEKEFELKANPVYNCSQLDYEQQFNFLISVRDKFNALQKTVKEIREIRVQMNAFAARLGKEYPKDLKEYADSLSKKMTEIEDAIYQTKLKSAQDILNYPIKLNDKIADLYNYAESGKTAPTKQVLEAFVELSALADVEINKWAAILKTEIPKLNTMFHANSLPVFGLGDKK